MAKSIKHCFGLIATKLKANQDDKVIDDYQKLESFSVHITVNLSENPPRQKNKERIIDIFGKILLTVIINLLLTKLLLNIGSLVVFYWTKHH